jgi:hypothetical protein
MNKQKSYKQMTIEELETLLTKTESALAPLIEQRDEIKEMLEIRKTLNDLFTRGELSPSSQTDNHDTAS